MLRGGEDVKGTSFSLPRTAASATTALLEELCAISSASDDVPGLRRMTNRLATELRLRGLSTEIRGYPDGSGAKQPVLLARSRSAGGNPMLLVGHLDTVLPAIKPRRVGGRLVATGALDMKGGFAALLAALDLLRSSGRGIPDDLLLVAVPDEEVSGRISEKVVRQWSTGARVVLVLEPGEGRGEAETLVAGRRGLTEWRLEVVGRAAHSGLAFWEGRSALVAAARWCTEASRLSRPGRGVTVNVARLVAGTTDFVDGLAHGYHLLGTSNQINVVPDRAIVEGEVRFLAAREGRQAVARLETLTRKLAASSGVDMALRPGITVQPVDPRGTGQKLVARAVQFAAARGWRLEVEEDRGGVSFPNYLAEPTHAPILDGLGPIGNGMHTREESVDLRSLARRSVLLADLLTDLATPQETKSATATIGDGTHRPRKATSRSR